MIKYKSDFDEYLDKYCKAHSKPAGDAESHAIVKEVKSYYDGQETANKANIQAQDGQGVK